MGKLVGVLFGLIILLEFLETTDIRPYHVLGAIAGIMVIGVLGAVVLRLSDVVKRRAAVNELRKQEKERLRQEKERLRGEEEQRLKWEQHSIQTNLTNIVSASKKAAAELPELVRNAEQSLNNAEHEFKDGAFAPFWDAVEKAAFKLATFNNHVQLLDRNALDYKDNVSRFNGSPPPFELGLRILPDASHTVERMRTIVRQAQKNFHFATIYEQRRTNQLLVSGFSTLGQALSELEDRLESSLDNLASSVTEAISYTASAHMTDLLAELKETRQHMARESEARREHERKEQEMLDNIQRGRKPLT